MIVCLSANPSIDKLFVVERLATGAIHRPVSFVQVAGGKGLNVARAAAALGGDVGVVSILGGHAGGWLAQSLGREGIPGRFAWMGAESRSCLSVADHATGELTEFYEAGHEIEPETWERLQTIVEELLPNATWFIISGSLPPGAPSRGYLDLVVAARAMGVTVALDTRDQSLALTLPAGPGIVKINAAEAAELLGTPTTSADAAVVAAEELRARAGQAATAVVTRGADGAVASTAGGSWSGRVDMRGPYPVGSGDAFLAGLVVGLDRGDDWARAFALALGAGAANAEVQGAGRLVRERAEQIAAGAEVVQLSHSADE
jgi:1-phosphofructokinase family hexose kinase